MKFRKRLRKVSTQFTEKIHEGKGWSRRRSWRPKEGLDTGELSSLTQKIWSQWSWLLLRPLYHPWVIYDQFPYLRTYLQMYNRNYPGFPSNEKNKRQSSAITLFLRLFTLASHAWPVNRLRSVRKDTSKKPTFLLTHFGTRFDPDSSICSVLKMDLLPD